MFEINNNDFRGMAICGAKLLEVNRPLVDSLNVFPVPDGDTGTNMSLTLSTAVQELSNLNSTATLAECTTAFSKGALKGARGNSGVISSQILKGFAVEAAGKEVFNAGDFAQALKKGTEIAYSAVTKPKEGTILTVVKAMAEKAQYLTRRKKDLEFLPFLEEVLAYGEEILQKTPEMLPVLKKAGVVDAGGKGLLFVIRGMYNSLAGIEIPDNPEEDKTISLSPVDAFSADDHEHINFSYCTEFFIINLRAKATLSDIDKLRDFLMTIGDCVLVIGDLELVKVHVHTNRPDLAMKNALKLGSLDSIKVENMVEQNRVLNEKREAEKAVELKDFGMISVCAGKGMEAIFLDLGIDKIVEGGQTMNPSVFDILGCINNVNAKEVFIFPNNKNIILAAEQARDLAEKKVYVIPTSNVAEGIAAAVCFMPESSAEENVANMNEAIGRVKCGQATTAVRNTRMDGFSVHEGDIIGLFGKKIVAKGTTVNEVVKHALKKMVDEDSSVISLYYGSDITVEASEQLIKELEAEYPDCEIMAFDGGQPYYFYIFSVE